MSLRARAIADGADYLATSESEAVWISYDRRELEPLDRFDLLARLREHFPDEIERIATIENTPGRLLVGVLGSRFEWIPFDWPEPP